MIYAFMEDGAVAVHGNLDDVRREHEAVDVENEDVVFYDEAGKRLTPRFTRPNVKTRLVGSMSWVAQGEFDLQPGVDQQDTIIARLRLAGYLQSNEFYASLDDIRAHFNA